MPDTPSTSDWLSPAEAAAYLGVTDRSVRNYVARGLLEARHIRGSRLIRIHVHDLEAMLAPPDEADLAPAASGGHRAH